MACHALWSRSGLQGFYELKSSRHYKLKNFWWHPNPVFWGFPPPPPPRDWRLIYKGKALETMLRGRNKYFKCDISWLRRTRIPASRRQTSWLFTSAVEELNLGLPRNDSNIVVRAWLETKTSGLKSNYVASHMPSGPRPHQQRHVLSNHKDRRSHNIFTQECLQKARYL